MASSVPSSSSCALCRIDAHREGRQVIEFTAPIRIESEMNRRDHWSKRRDRFNDQKVEVSLAWPMHRGFRKRVTVPCVVTLTRVGPRKLDSDNLAGGFKAVRDQLARFIGVDDGSPWVEWKYAQEKGKPKEYAVRVKIETACGASEPATKDRKGERLR